MNTFARKILIISIFFLSTTSLFSQQLITLELRNKPLKTVLQNISRQSGYFFAYSSDKINNNQKVTIIAEKQPLNIVLQKLCDQLNLTYTIAEKQIILKPSTEIPKPLHQRTIQYFTISGYVTDSTSGENLIGANIYLDQKLKGFSNELGYFTIKSSKGLHQLKIQYTGYKSFVKKINIQNDTFIKAKLTIEPQILDIVVVTAKNNTGLSNSSLDFQDFKRQIILRNPGLGGTFDALKNLQAIPGFNFMGDGSLIFNVRGGLRSQNLITIDDAPLFNPVHLLGFFSSISPYAINTIRVFKDYIPVKYPGAGSAVIDIQLRNGNYYRKQIQAVINPILNSYLIDGPITKGRSSFMLTLRHSNYLNFNLNNKKSLLNINFADLQAKLNFKLSKSNKISITGVLGGDKIKLTQNFLASKIWWYNAAGTFRWFHTFSPNLLLKTVAYAGSYTYFLQFKPDTTNIFNSLIFKTGIKSDLTYHFNQNSILLGANLNYYYFNPANINDYAYLPSQNATENSFYLGSQWYFDDFKLNAGLSYRFFANFGPTYLYQFDRLHNFIGIDTIGFKIYHTFSALEPRISLSYKLLPRWIIKCSWGKYYQFLQLLSNSISPFTTVEAWLPSSPNIPPIKSWQAALGIAKINSEINFSVEVYYKKIFNFVEFSNFSSLLFNPYIEGQLRFGHAVSSGIEISARRDKGRLNFWLAYNYSRTFFQTPDLWGNAWYPAHYDKPHIFYFNLAYNKNRLQAGLTFIYTSGNRFTAPVGFYEVLDHLAPVYSLPNNAQMPPYQRLDLFLKYRLNRKKRNFEHYLTLSIFNVLNRKNAVLVSFNKIYDQQNNYFYVPDNYIYQYQISPSFYYLFKTIPMISYTFLLK